MTFVVTRAPLSRQIWATALSKANTLLPNTPDLPDAARWWPRTSRRQPHKQVRTDKGKGNRRRRSNNTRNGSASILDTRCSGIAVKGTDDKGPLRPHHRTFGTGEHWPHLLFFRWLSFRRPQFRSSSCCKGLPRWSVHHHLAQLGGGVLHCRQTPCSSAGEPPDDLPGKPGMSVPDHLEEVGPTPPVGGASDPPSSTDPETT